MRYKFEDIAINSIAKKKPTEADKFTYIGLEHLDPGTFVVSRYGSEVAPKGEKLLMKKGDVLFGKRRAYQKKVAIAPFDGIFSAHGMVLRPKEDVVESAFFPFFISSDYFLDAAINISVGSLSPTINWGTLKSLEFELPPLEEQRKLAELLWAANDAQEAYKKLSVATNELITAQFIEVFGDPKINLQGWKVKPLSEITIHANNGITRRGSDEDGNIVLRLVEVQDGFIDYSSPNRMKLDDAEKERYLLKDGDFLFARVNGNPEYVGRCAVFRNTGEEVYHNDHIIRVRFDASILNAVFASELLNSQYGKDEMKDKVKTSAGQYTINQAGIGSIKAPLPPIETQNDFARFIIQAKKSRFELQCAIKDLESIYKALLSENLG